MGHWVRGVDFNVVKKHVSGPQGVRGRNSDNTLLRETLSWEPSIPLEDGLARTYAWIETQVEERLSRSEVTRSIGGVA